MDYVKLLKIHQKGHSISFDYEVSPGLQKYFSADVQFTIEYFLNGHPITETESVPHSICAIPFVCNVLPIIWITNARLIIPALDKEFWECLPQIKQGYKAMFPESVFLGEIYPQKIVENHMPSQGAACFYSGGLDATQTLISHLAEQPHLLSIWGADIKYDNETGWQVVRDSLQKTASCFDIPLVEIRSSFREFDQERVLDADYSAQLKDGWWHGVKHGIGLLGHAAPYAFMKGLSAVYIASSNCPQDGKVRCASHPSIDNHVRFCGCQIVHDGYHFSRQDKVQNIVDYCTKTQKYFSLHVCWESQAGGNCCYCEKCYRTMAAIIASGSDPVLFGFEKAYEALPQMRDNLLISNKISPFLASTQWIHIQNKLISQQQQLKRSPFWNSVKWLLTVDCFDIRSYSLPLGYRIRQKLSQYRFYQKLHEIKVKFHG